jgi:hypothetical protein
VSHGVSLGLLVKRDGGKLPSFLASESLDIIVLSGDLWYNGICFGGNHVMHQIYTGVSKFPSGSDSLSLNIE